MSRPFCSDVAMLQDGASSGVFFVNKLALAPLVDFKMNVIKWKLHFVSCNFGEIKLVITNHAFDFRSNCTPLSAITIINHYSTTKQ